MIENRGSSVAVINTAVAWASAAATPSTTYQVLGFSGGASLHSCSIKLFIGNTLKWIGYSLSSHVTSEYWGSLGIYSGTNQQVAVKTEVTGRGPVSCGANLIYRIVL